ncbi:MAG TPA: cytosine permease [Streptosporangiales bacterium]
MRAQPTSTRSADEVPLTLAEPPPKRLSGFDQAAFWGNLGVSLLGFGGAVAVLAPTGVPRLSPVAAAVAAVVGTVLGSLALAASTVPGAQTGAPAMVLLRGLFGTRLSYVPTVLNVLQLVGWGTFELVIIAQSAQSLFGGHGPRWAYVVGFGVLTTALTIRPLGTVRLLRRFAAVLVLAALVFFAVVLLRHPLPAAGGSWRGFWLGADAALAVAVSWVPLSADYSRHSRTTRAAFAGSFLAYTVTQSVTYLLGLLALALVAGDPERAFDPLVAAPAGAVFFGVLVLRELDQSFATVYSTAVSVQNLRPFTDRRVLSGCAGAVTTGLALTVDISRYQSFLYLLGSVFVPMLAVLLASYFLGGGRHRWNVSERAPARWSMLAAWLLGFVAYQLVNPGAIPGWTAGWVRVQHWLHFTPQSWMSASVLSFLVAAVIATVLVRIRGRVGG